MNVGKNSKNAVFSKRTENGPKNTRILGGNIKVQRGDLRQKFTTFFSIFGPKNAIFGSFFDPFFVTFLVLFYHYPAEYTHEYDMLWKEDEKRTIICENKVVKKRGQKTTQKWRFLAIFEILGSDSWGVLSLVQKSASRPEKSSKNHHFWVIFDPFFWKKHEKNDIF